MSNSLLNLVLGRLPSYTRKARHLQLLRRYAKPSKLSNIARAELSRIRGDISLKSRPYIYTVDTGNLCNLRCPLCPTGYQGLERTQALMSLETFEAIIEKIGPYAIEVIMHNWGEPFLNPQILDMFRHARKNKIGTAVSSNLNLVNQDETFLEEVVDAGLDHLTVSIDGATQDIYSSYRRGGELENVLHNLRHLLAYRRKVGSSTPLVEWQFLVMKHNQHQIAEVRKLADEIGVDRLRFTGAGLPFNDLANIELGKQWISDLPSYQGYAPEKIQKDGYLYDENCFYLYRAMTINPKGEVSPCCALYHEKWDFGNLLGSSLDEVWNNAHYRSSRALFSGKPEHMEQETVCSRCPLFNFDSKRTHQIAAAS